MDAKRLLDQFLGAGSAGGLGGALGGSMGHGRGGLPGQGGGGLLGELQRGVGGMLGGQGGRTGGGDLMGNLNRHANANPLASGALAGGLASVLLGGRGGRGMSRDVVKLGGLALVAGMAYKAYQDHQAKQGGGAQQQGVQPEIVPPPAGSPFMPEGNAAEDRARLLITAMIAAAKADGYIDQGEQQRIFDRVGALDLDAESKAYLMDQLRSPLDLDAIVAKARQPEVATEVYAASLLAIDPDHPAEKAYLQMLAARLGLEEDLVAEIHTAAESARV